MLNGLSISPRVVVKRSRSPLVSYIDLTADDDVDRHNDKSSSVTMTTTTTTTTVTSTDSVAGEVGGAARKRPRDSERFVCPVTRKPFTQPLVLYCGHTLDACSIDFLLERTRPSSSGIPRVPKCPVCKEPMLMTQTASGAERWVASDLFPVNRIVANALALDAPPLDLDDEAALVSDGSPSPVAKRLREAMQMSLNYASLGTAAGSAVQRFRQTVLTINQPSALAPSAPSAAPVQVQNGVHNVGQNGVQNVGQNVGQTRVENGAGSAWATVALQRSEVSEVLRQLQQQGAQLRAAVEQSLVCNAATPPPPPPPPPPLRATATPAAPAESVGPASASTSTGTTLPFSERVYLTRNRLATLSARKGELQALCQALGVAYTSKRFTIGAIVNRYRYVDAAVWERCIAK